MKTLLTLVTLTVLILTSACARKQEYQYLGHVKQPKLEVVNYDGQNFELHELDNQ